MSDGTILNLGVGGDTIYNKDNGASKTAVTLLAVGTSSPFTSLASATNPVPTQLSVGNTAASTTNPLPVAPVPVTGAAYAPNWAPNLATVSATVHTGACNLRSATFINKNAAIRWFQVWDSTTTTGTLILEVPLDGSTSTAISSKAVGADILGPEGIAITNGITFGFSTGSGTYSGGTAADHNCFIAWK